MSKKISVMSVETSCKKNVKAKTRWKILAKAITRNGCNHEENSLVRFPSYNVITAQVSDDPNPNDRYLWYDVKLPECTSVKFKVCGIRASTLKLNDLTGFNNTGNICIWPSEECLAQYCIENIDIFSGKSVIELGGGMTSLAALVVSSFGKPKEVLMTDGNELSVENLKKICTENPHLTDIISSRLLKWDDVPSDVTSNFDFAICSDCLFFDDGRPQLLSCLRQVLKPNGVGIIIAPSRHGTFEKFTQLLKLDGHFSVEESDNYSDKIVSVANIISQDVRFDSNLHWPKLLKICKL